MNIQNLWFEESKEKYHQFLSEIINFHNPKIAIRGVLISSGWSSLIRVIAVEQISGLLIELQRRLCKDAQYGIGLH